MRFRKVFIVCLIIWLMYFLLSCETKNEPKVEGNEHFKVINGKRTQEIVFNFNAVASSKKTRKWIDIKLSSKFKLGEIENDLFLFPTQVRTDIKKNIYVLDFVDCSVKKFNNKGKFIKKYGSKGKGPGEFTNAFSYDISDEGKVVIANDNDNKFVVYQDEEFFEYKAKLMPSSVCFVSENDVVTFQFTDPLSKAPFQKINYKNKSITDYQNIFSSKSFGGENYGMLPLIIGDIHRINPDNMVYVSTVMGYVILYSGSGNITKTFKLIDKVHQGNLQQKEKIKNVNVPIIRFPKFDEQLYLSSHVFGNKLFVLEILGERNVKNYMENLVKKEYFVDVYSLEDCEYKYSILLKDFGGLRSVYFTDTELYLIKESTEIEVFTYNIIESN